MSSDKIIKLPLKVTSTPNNEANEFVITPFEDLKITTMTLVIPLNGIITDLGAIFSLIPITRVILPPPKRQAQKYKIPKIDIPGAVLSMRYRGNVRGIIRTTNGKYFKNSITIDIATSVKNVSIKLSSGKIHMCGAKSEAIGIEGANHIINHVNNIQSILDKIHRDPITTRKVFDWILDVTKGDPFPKYAKEDHSCGSVKLQIIKEVGEDFHIVVPTMIPAGIDYDLACFLLDHSYGFICYSDYAAMLEWMLTVEKVVEGDLKIKEVNRAMVNYNYRIGYNIDRFQLMKNIHGMDGFFARYENTIEYNVTIELPYEVPPDCKIVRKKGKVPCHIFLGYKSGIITQSGPCEKLMEPAYYKFMNAISKIYHKITQPM